MARSIRQTVAGKNVHAVELGKLGGRKGGPARARALSSPTRSAIARKAARARWARKGVKRTTRR